MPHEGLFVDRPLPLPFFTQPDQERPYLFTLIASNAVHHQLSPRDYPLLNKLDFHVQVFAVRDRPYQHQITISGPDSSKISALIPGFRTIHRETASSDFLAFPAVASPTPTLSTVS